MHDDENRDECADTEVAEDIEADVEDKFLEAIATQKQNYDIEIIIEIITVTVIVIERHRE